MKILYILSRPFGTRGTAASYMFPSIVNQLGYDVYIMAPKGGKKYIETRIFKNDKLKFIYFSSNNSMLKNTLLLKKIMKDLRPNIVHVFFKRWSFLYPSVSKLFETKDTKWILDIRSPLINSGIKRIAAKVIGPFEQLGFDCICAHVISSAKDVLNLMIKRSFELPPGVDIKAFPKKKDIQRLNNPIRFIYVGAIAKVRELDKLIEGIAIAKKSIKKKQNIEVDFFGTGDALQQLKIQSEILNLSKTVNFKDELPQNELFKKMSEYDVGIAYIPQKIYKNSPGLKTLEYMAASLLVIASNTAGNRMFIEDNYNGILMDNSPPMIAEAILKSISVKNVKSYISNSYKIAQMYDWEKIVKDKLIPNYDILIKN